MKLLTDFHHTALAESLMMLFYDRYNVDVYFPVGMEWFESGIWQFEKAYYGDSFARKLLVDYWRDASENDGIYSKVSKNYPGRVMTGVTLDRARDIDIDIVLSTLPHNDQGYHIFATQSGARFGVQVGNNHQISRWDLATFALFSSTIDGYQSPSDYGRVFVWNGIPSVIYHQEFDAKNIFYPDASKAMGSNIVSSFISRMADHPAMSGDYQLFKVLADNFPEEIDWRAYGSNVFDGISRGDITYMPDVADLMRQTRIACQIKAIGDGFGHTIHNWAAIGRPLLWVKNYYDGKLAAPLWIDGETSWDIGNMSLVEISAIIDRLKNDDDFWMEASLKAIKRFDELVNFTSEADEIASMLDIK